MNTVFTKIAGQGEPLLVLHGWGMNHKVWSVIEDKLEQLFRVTWIDLPGHGESQGCLLRKLDYAVDQIVPLLRDDRGKQPMHIMGWSLGGLIAQRLAERFPDLVNSLILVATSPSFIQRENWPHAMSKEVIQRFIEKLDTDYKTTIQRFLALQFMGVKGVKPNIKRLKDEIILNPPCYAALQDGLDILYHTDLRSAEITCPKFWIQGELDRLIPVSVATDLVADQSSVYIIDKAGHAPFISHPNEFMNYVTKCLSDVGTNQ